MSSDSRPSSWDATMHLVGFQSHTHNLGRVVSTFRSTNNAAPANSVEHFYTFMSHRKRIVCCTKRNIILFSLIFILFLFFKIELATGNPLWPNSYTSRYLSSSINFNIFSRCVYTSTGVANDTNTSK